MSLEIDSRYITGIYALGQWFSVKKGSVDVDAYEFTNWEEDPSGIDPPRFNCHFTDYLMGDVLRKAPRKPKCGSYRADAPGRWASPAGCDGISFTCALTGERVSFALVLVRAFKEERS
jgi:hypothetical protein